MKQPGVVLHHLGDDYLLVEGGFSADTRTVTVLCAADNERFPHAEGTRPVTWRDQGEWFPVARWSPLETVLQDESHENGRTLVLDLVERHVDECGDLPARLYALAEDKGFAYSLEAILPMGLAVPVFDDEERAREEAEARGAHVVAIHSPLRFMTHLAREGYAGAMWNRSQPVYTCIDAEGSLQFLRVGRAASSKVALDILGADEEWTPYEGEAAIEFLEHGEACDARMAASLGRVPVLDWPADGRLWTTGPRSGEAGIVTVDGDAVPHVLLFSSEAAAAEWAEESEERWTSWPVDDLAAFLGSPAAQGCAGLLNPGAHRVRSGVLWADGPRVVLDCFSGFWALGPDGTFSPIE